MFLTRLRNDAEGSSLVEFTVVLSLLFIFLGGLLDFMYISWQRDMLIKAVERGARIAAVSDPVAGGPGGFNNQSAFSAPGGCTPGNAYPPASFDCKCSGATGACTAGPLGACGLTYSAASMNTIVYGRGGTTATCGTAGKNPYSIGMCDLYKLTTANVSIEYSDTGLGFCGSPAGQVPTITVSVQNIILSNFFLPTSIFPNALNLTTGNNFAAPAKTTITGEDLSFASP
jgi:TadE-like protein